MYTGYLFTAASLLLWTFNKDNCWILLYGQPHGSYWPSIRSGSEKHIQSEDDQGQFSVWNYGAIAFAIVVLCVFIVGITYRWRSWLKVKPADEECDLRQDNQKETENQRLAAARLNVQDPQRAVPSSASKQEPQSDS